MIEKPGNGDVENFLNTQSWKYIKQEFEIDQDKFKELLIQTSPKTETGQNNIIHYQAMYNAIDELFDKVKGLIGGE